jgi:hypothetical protein
MPDFYSRVLLSGRPGNLQLVAREGDPIPGLQPPATQVFDWIRINSAGQILLQGVIDELSYEQGQYLSLVAPGSFQLIARSATPAPGTSEEFRDFWAYFLNDAGQIAFESTTDKGNQGIWVGTPQGLQLVARSRLPAPGTGRNFGDLRLDAFNNRGDVAFQEVSGDGIWIHSQDGFKHVAQTSQPSPVPGYTYDFVSDVYLGQNGNLQFRSTLSGAGITDANDTAFFAGPPDDLKLIAREGDLAPGAGLPFIELKNMFASPSGAWMEFCASLDPTHQTGGAACDSLWISDPAGNLHLITFVGQTIDINGVPWPVQFVASYGGINDDGFVAYTLMLNQNTFATFIASVPEPTSTAFLLIALFLITRVRRRYV